MNDNREIISHRFEAMGVDAQGNIHLAWLDKRDQSAARNKGENYAGSAVYYALSKDAGKTFSTNRKLIDNSCECCRTAMDFDADGSPVIFWRHIYGRNVRDHALLKLDGQSQPVRVSYDHWEVAACPHHGGAISIDANNNYHLTWFNNGPERHGLFYAHSSDQGKTFSTAIHVGNYDAQAAHPFVLAIKQNVYLVWKEFDGKQSLIQLMHSTDQGNTWRAVTTLATSDGASDHPLLISDGNTAWLSWHTARQGLVFMAIESDNK
ncbi:MAG: exo-alpha-sialidase [Gammaproteobacteria bacterium]|nr:exo-alpha-sialidase [Gammaproteobacteria bacterium]